MLREVTNNNIQTTSAEPILLILFLLLFLPRLPHRFRLTTPSPR